MIDVDVDVDVKVDVNENLVELYIAFDKHLMEDDKPSGYFNALFRENMLTTEYPLKMLGELKNTNQSPQHHPEGSVWNHTMLVLDYAALYKAQSKNPRNFMWAALLHDIGKPGTTKLRKGKITSYDHDKLGEQLAIQFLKNFTSDEDFINNVSKLVRWHMQILFVTKSLPFGDIKGMKQESDIDEIALLGLCDRLGRGDMNEEKMVTEKNNIELFKQKCK